MCRRMSLYLDTQRGAIAAYHLQISIMANMSYCRFQNTVSDFDDCLDVFKYPDEQDEFLSAAERLAARSLLLKAVEMAALVADYGDDVAGDVFDNPESAVDAFLAEHFPARGE